MNWGTNSSVYHIAEQQSETTRGTDNSYSLILSDRKEMEESGRQGEVSLAKEHKWMHPSLW